MTNNTKDEPKLIMNRDMDTGKTYSCEDTSKEPEVNGLIKIKDLLKDIALLKKYAIEVDSEPIYLCADHLEEQLNKLRYGDHLLETSWR